VAAGLDVRIAYPHRVLTLHANVVAASDRSMSQKTAVPRDALSPIIKPVRP
jgi:hypothetical protein